jgi:hypothetical protein
MGKSDHAPTSPSIVLSWALLLCLFVSASCGTAAGPTAQAVRTGADTGPDRATANRTTPIAGTPGTATLDADGGFDCGGVNQIPAVECGALVALYHSTNGPNWADRGGWLTSDTPCAWSGIDCEGGHVSHIHLLYNELAGTLPPELGDLSHLRVLSLWVNRLCGPIPAELGNLSELVSLELSDNQLTGPLPAELSRLAKLHTLALAFNQLSGSIPPALGHMRGLNSLNLSHNQLSGAIPAELDDLVNLYQLDLSHNQLSGAIPAALGGSGKLDELDLSYNQLRGAVPESLAQISQRSLWGNQLEGTIAGSNEALIAVDYQGVHFTADPSLAISIWPEVMPATTAVEGGPFWYAAPGHLRFTFADPNLLPGRLRMGINLAAEAQILVYPLAELAGLGPQVEAQIEALQSLLTEQEPVPAGDLPLLPPTNAVQVFHAQARYLDLGHIRGLRFITQHTQEDRPVVSNRGLFYTFQGVTGDDAWYVAVFFPLTTAVLPDTNAVDDPEAFGANYATYLSETTALLDQLPPTEFDPDLALLDAVVTSLRLEAVGMPAGAPTMDSSKGEEMPHSELALGDLDPDVLASPGTVGCSLVDLPPFGWKEVNSGRVDIRAAEEYRISVESLYQEGFRAYQDNRVDFPEEYGATPEMTYDEFLTTCNVFPDVDFSQYSLLGYHATGTGCQVAFERHVYRDDANKVILYELEVIEKGTCQTAVRDRNLILVPRIPSEYRVTFILSDPVE